MSAITFEILFILLLILANGLFAMAGSLPFWRGCPLVCVSATQRTRLAFRWLMTSVSVEESILVTSLE